MKKNRLFLVAALFLTACSHYTSNGEREYLQSRNGVDLVVPRPLTAMNISHFYDLPAQNQSAQVSITPPSNPALRPQTS